MLDDRSPSSRPGNAQIFSSFFYYTLLFACTALPLIRPGSAQTIVNGQIYTKALAIVDAPQPGSTYHAGSPLTIAIDTSGNGKLSSAAMIPNSGLPTSFDSLKIYLVSAQTGLNVTVSSGSGLLTQESGSTVKHLNWAVPNCLDAGAYNLTFYEGSRVTGTSYYSITSLSIILDNSNPGSSCDMQTNSLEVQPQADNAPLVNPWLGDTSAASGSTSSLSATSPIATSTSSSSGIPGVWTFTVGSTGLSWPFTITTATPAGASPTSAQTITRTIGQSVPATTVTVVLASLQTQTLTFSGSGLTTTVTSTATSLSTTTAILKVSDGGTAGFFPVSASPPQLVMHLRLWTCLSGIVAFVTLL